MAVMTEETTVEAAPSSSVAESETKRTAAIDWDLVRLVCMYLFMDYTVRGIVLMPGFRSVFGALTGVALSLLLFAYARWEVPWARQEFGLTLRQLPGSIPLSLTGVFFLAGVGVYVGMAREPEVWSLLGSFHSVVASPFAEELAFRGIALTALCRAFGSRGVLWPLLITSMFFVWCHAPFRSGMNFNALVFIVYLAGLSVILGAMRMRSGSVVFPILGHMALNGAIAVVYRLRLSGWDM